MFTRATTQLTDCRYPVRWHLTAGEHPSAVWGAAAAWRATNGPMFAATAAVGGQRVCLQPLVHTPQQQQHEQQQPQRGRQQVSCATSSTRSSSSAAWWPPLPAWLPREAMAAGARAMPRYPTHPHLGEALRRQHPRLQPFQCISSVLSNSAGRAAGRASEAATCGAGGGALGASACGGSLGGGAASGGHAGVGKCEGSDGSPGLAEFGTCMLEAGNEDDGGAHAGSGSSREDINCRGADDAHIVFDVFAPKSTFSRTAPGPPAFRVAMAGAGGGSADVSGVASFPPLRQLLALSAASGVVPLRFAVVSGSEAHFYDVQQAALLDMIVPGPSPLAAAQEIE